MYYNGRLVEGFYSCACFFDYTLEKKNDTYFNFIEGLPAEIFHVVFLVENTFCYIC